jgi:hypothetical protein
MKKPKWKLFLALLCFALSAKGEEYEYEYEYEYVDEDELEQDGEIVEVIEEYVEEDKPASKQTLAQNTSPSTNEDDYFEKKSFNDALHDLFQEFAFDLKSKEVPDADHVCIRRIILTENIPTHYQTYVEALAQETYKTNTPFRMVLCPECRIRKRMVKDGEVILINPVNHSDVLDRLAQQLGIDVWLDLSLIYQIDNLALSVKLFDQYTKELIWAKTYDSQSIYRKYLLEKRNAAAKENNDVRVDEKTLSSLNFIIEVCGGLMPNVSTSSVFLGPSLGISESFKHLPLSLLLGFGIKINAQDLKRDYTNYTGNPENNLDVTVFETEDQLVPLRAIFNPWLKFRLHLGGRDAESARNQPINTYFILGGGGLFGRGFLNAEAISGLSFTFNNHFFLSFLGGFSPPSNITFKGFYIYEAPGGVSFTLGGGLEF